MNEWRSAIEVWHKGEAGYPAQFEDWENAPKEIYAIGDTSLLSRPMLAIVGHQNPTGYGREVAEHFAQMASDAGIIVLTGGSMGTESAAMMASEKSVAVLPGGLANPYPLVNEGLFKWVIKQGGCIVSEQEPDILTSRLHFQRRDRLIAKLASAVLVVEADFPSGAYSECCLADSFGCEILAVPGPITSNQSKGTNYLIRMGRAVPIIDDASFIHETKRLFPECNFPDLPKNWAL